MAGLINWNTLLKLGIVIIQNRTGKIVHSPFMSLLKSIKIISSLLDTLFSNFKIFFFILNLTLYFETLNFIFKYRQKEEITPFLYKV